MVSVADRNTVSIDAEYQSRWRTIAAINIVYTDFLNLPPAIVTGISRKRNKK